MVTQVNKRDEQDFASFIKSEQGFLDAFARYEDEPIALEPYQVAFLSGPTIP